MSSAKKRKKTAVIEMAEGQGCELEVPRCKHSYRERRMERKKTYIYSPHSTKAWRAKCFKAWREEVDECGRNLGAELSGRMRGNARSATYDDT